MGIVQNQSLKNTIITYLGFGFGALNIIILYIEFLTDEYHGLVTYVMSTANVMMPFVALGVHNTIVKFYSTFKNRNSVNSFLTLMLLLPLISVILIGSIGCLAFDIISSTLSQKNDIIQNYVWLIFIAAISLAYFEVFYAWAKVQFQSVFGNFMKEVFHRVFVTVFFIGVYFEWLTATSFIYALTFIYVLRTLIMMIYAFSIRRPVFKFCKLKTLPSILKYTFLIVIAGSVANIVLDIDKFMLGQYINIENVAFYGVATYISLVISVPARAMHQITYPITAKLLNDKNVNELSKLYRKSSLNLFIIGGFVFLLIVLNINELYHVLPPQYSGGVLIVFLIGLAKLMDNLLGNNNAILFNSDYYRVVLLLGVFLAILAIVFNMILIPTYGIYGAALATFLTIMLYNSCKIGFVYVKFKIQPFSKNTFKTLILLLLSLGLFYFWEFPFHAIINIGLKSILITLFYGLIIYKFNLSEDITLLLDKYKRKIF